MQSAWASQTESSYFHLLSIWTPYLTKKGVLTRKVAVIQLVLYCDSTMGKRAYMSGKLHKGYFAVPHEIISGHKPGSLLYKDQVLWFHGKYQSW